MSIRVFILFLVSVIGVHSSTAQDLFDYENSKLFADYLYQSKQFESAVSEYHRVVYLNPSDIEAWENLVKSVQHLRLYDESIQLIDSANYRLGYSSGRLGRLKAYGILKTNQMAQLTGIIDTYSLSSADLEVIQYSKKALNGEWEYFLDPKFKPGTPYAQQYVGMAREIANQRLKSKALAGVLSTFVPGTGKIYAGRWKDGLFSLLLVGVTGWQTYRLVNKNGVANFGSIVFGGFAMGLYTGNIYGSVKATKEFNNRKKIENYQKANHLLDSYFGYFSE